MKPVPRDGFTAPGATPGPFLFTMTAIIAYSNTKVYILRLFFTHARFSEIAL